MIQEGEFRNVIELLDYFKDEDTCKKYLEVRRWRDGVCCPECGNQKVYRTNRGFRCADRACAKKFTVTIGTVMENSNIKLRYWFAAIYLISAHKKGISSHQLARDLGVTQKTAWFMTHRIREMLKTYSTIKFRGTVSVDEMYVGGKSKNKHKNKREKGSQGRSGKGKKPVLGILEQDGMIRSFPIKNTASATIQPILEDNIEEGSTLMTDEWKGYNKAGKKFNHKRVNHSAKQYVDGLVHVNGVENYWSHLSRSIIGTYHWISVTHMGRYCDEMSYRYNTRGKSDCERFNVILTHTTGRLKWNNLVGAQ